MTAYQALKIAGADSLPIQPKAVAVCLGIKVVDYATCAVYYGYTMQELYERSPEGFSFLDAQTGSYVCAINENIYYEQRRRWTLAHEIGHAALGHLDGDSTPTQEMEQQANRFAAELLAPSTVLHFCSVASAKELASLCDLSCEAGEYRFSELQAMRRDDVRGFRSGKGCSFLASDEQKQCFADFSPFISSYITRRLSSTAPPLPRENLAQMYKSGRYSSQK